jgi:hypothetical protein
MKAFAHLALMIEVAALFAACQNAQNGFTQITA